MVVTRTTTSRRSGPRRPLRARRRRHRPADVAYNIPRPTATRIEHDRCCSSPTPEHRGGEGLHRRLRRCPNWSPRAPAGFEVYSATTGPRSGSCLGAVGIISVARTWWAQIQMIDLEDTGDIPAGRKMRALSAPPRACSSLEPHTPEGCDGDARSARPDRPAAAGAATAEERARPQGAGGRRLLSPAAAASSSWEGR